MTQKKQSKEERYLVKLYESAKTKGDPEREIDRYEVGHILGEHTRSVDNIVRLLCKNNFLKKGDENLVYLTPAGIQFVRSLKHS